MLHARVVDTSLLPTNTHRAEVAEGGLAAGAGDGPEPRLTLVSPRVPRTCPAWLETHFKVPVCRHSAPRT